MPSYRFQDGLTLDRHIGQTLTVHGENFELKEILSEKQSNEFNERWAVFQATKSGSTDAFVLKLRFQYVCTLGTRTVIALLTYRSISDRIHLDLVKARRIAFKSQLNETLKLNAKH